MNTQYILLILMIILGCISATILVSDYNKDVDNIKIDNYKDAPPTSTLKYAFYNYTTGEVTYKDSNIPIYND